MTAASFASYSWRAFTLTQKVTVPAAILFRSISMAASRISASGAPTNVAFPPSPIHLLTAFKNDWLSHKYSNSNSISVSRSTRKNAANSGWFELESSPLVPLCTAVFSCFFSSYYILLPFCLVCLNRHLSLLGPETHSLQACLSLCPSSNCILSLSFALDNSSLPPDTSTPAAFFKAAFCSSATWQSWWTQHEAYSSLTVHLMLPCRHHAFQRTDCPSPPFWAQGFGSDPWRARRI